MRRTWVFLTMGLALLPLTGHGTESAQVTLFCWSLRFSQGQGSFDETLDLSTISGTPNGELALADGGYSHISMFALDFSGYPITGTLGLNLPPFQDADGNGFDDSLEVSQGASGNSSGEYVTAIGGGTVSATWSRDAGSRLGTCWLHLVDDNYGDLGTYRHTFEVLEYKGTLTYTPGSNNVTGSMILTNESARFEGTTDFVKSSGNPYDALTLMQSSWTNDLGQVLSMNNGSSVFRDTVLLTNYYCFVVFNDGDPSTSAGDYYNWELSIDDLNDSDHDTIPDLSDDPQAVLLQQPSLALTPTATNLLLGISGDIGHTCWILEASSLDSGSWVTNQSLTLANNPQTVSLPLSTNQMKFWRVLTE